MDRILRRLRRLVFGPCTEGVPYERVPCRATAPTISGRQQVAAPTQRQAPAGAAAKAAAICRVCRGRLRPCDR